MTKGKISALLTRARMTRAHLVELQRTTEISTDGDRHLISAELEIGLLIEELKQLRDRLTIRSAA